MNEFNLRTLEPRIRGVFDALDGLNRTYGGEGEYHCNSPRRPNANGHSFSLKVDDTGLTFHDFNDAGKGPVKGNLFDLENILGISPTPVADVVRKHNGGEAKDLASYVAQHAGDLAYWKKAGWKDTLSEGKRAIGFLTQNGTRYRLLDGDSKYRSPKGFKQCWYRLSEAIELAEEVNGPLVLCNGEASVVSAQYFGVPATALAGGKGYSPRKATKRTQSGLAGPDHRRDGLRSQRPQSGA